MFLEHFISIFFSAVAKKVVDREQNSCSKGHILIFFRKVQDDVYNHYCCQGEEAGLLNFGTFFTKIVGDESFSNGDTPH